MPICFKAILNKLLKLYYIFNGIKNNDCKYWVKRFSTFAKCRQHTIRHSVTNPRPMSYLPNTHQAVAKHWTWRWICINVQGPHTRLSLYWYLFNVFRTFHPPIASCKEILFTEIMHWILVSSAYKQFYYIHLNISSALNSSDRFFHKGFLKNYSANGKLGFKKSIIYYSLIL